MFIEIEDRLINTDNVVVISRQNPNHFCEFYRIIIDTTDDERWELNYKTEEERDMKWEWLRGTVLMR